MADLRSLQELSGSDSVERSSRNTLVDVGRLLGPFYLPKSRTRTSKAILYLEAINLKMNLQLFDVMPLKKLITSQVSFRSFASKFWSSLNDAAFYTCRRTINFPWQTKAEEDGKKAGQDRPDNAQWRRLPSRSKLELCWWTPSVNDTSLGFGKFLYGRNSKLGNLVEWK